MSFLRVNFDILPSFWPLRILSWDTKCKFECFYAQSNDQYSEMKLRHYNWGKSYSKNKLEIKHLSLSLSYYSVIRCRTEIGRVQQLLRREVHHSDLSWPVLISTSVRGRSNLLNSQAETGGFWGLTQETEKVFIGFIFF